MTNSDKTPDLLPCLSKAGNEEKDRLDVALLYRLADEIGFRAAWNTRADIVSIPADAEPKGIEFDTFKDTGRLQALDDLNYLLGLAEIVHNEIRRGKTVRCLGDIKQRLSAALSVPSVIPDGYALVPIEPTFEMIEVGMNARYYEGYSLYDIYRAMIASAPKGIDEKD